MGNFRSKEKSFERGTIIINSSNMKINLSYHTPFEIRKHKFSLILKRILKQHNILLDSNDNQYVKHLYHIEVNMKENYYTNFISFLYHFIIHFKDENFNFQIKIINFREDLNKTKYFLYETIKIFENELHIHEKKAFTLLLDEYNYTIVNKLGLYITYSNYNQSLFDILQGFSLDYRNQKFFILNKDNSIDDIINFSNLLEYYQIKFLKLPATFFCQFIDTSIIKSVFPIKVSENEIAGSFAYLSIESLSKFKNLQILELPIFLLNIYEESSNLCENETDYEVVFLYEENKSENNKNFTRLMLTDLFKNITPFFDYLNENFRNLKLILNFMLAKKDRGEIKTYIKTIKNMMSKHMKLFYSNNLKIDIKLNMFFPKGVQSLLMFCNEYDGQTFLPFLYAVNSKHSLVNKLKRKFILLCILRLLKKITNHFEKKKFNKLEYLDWKDFNVYCTEIINGK